MSSETITVLRELSLAGVAITATVDGAGGLHPVGGEFEKLLAAAREKSFPRIHSVVVSDKQPLDQSGLEKDSHNERVLQDRHADFHVVLAPTMAEAVELLELDARTRWGPIIDCSQRLREHRDFVGRRGLHSDLDAFLHGSRASGYFVITGLPGAGKSAFIADRVRQERGPIYHFVARGRWSDPTGILDSLAAQLRRRYGLSRGNTSGESLRPEHRDDPRERVRVAADKLSEVLEQVSRRLNPGDRAVLWLDGLDQAYGATTPFAGMQLPSPLCERLPDWIFVVLTSRPGEHLNWFADPSLADIHPIEGYRETPDTDTREYPDIREYLDARNCAERLGLSKAFIDTAVQCSEGNFLFTVLLLKDIRELEPARRTPDCIPAGLHGWMVKELQYVVSRWQELRNSSRYAV